MYNINESQKHFLSEKSQALKLLFYLYNILYIYIEYSVYVFSIIIIFSIYIFRKYIFSIHIIFRQRKIYSNRNQWLSRTENQGPRRTLTYPPHGRKRSKRMDFNMGYK